MAKRSLIFSAPSGSGKTTIIHSLMKRQTDLVFSISATSRPKRPKEIEGKDYYFLTEQSFKQKISTHAFLEWEEVYPKKYYGTLKSEVERLWKQNKIVVFDVDVLGGLTLKKKLGDSALSIYVKTPSLQELATRLRHRGSETPEEIAKRIDRARYEMRFEKKFDCIVMNDTIDHALRQVNDIYKKFTEHKQTIKQRRSL